MMCIVYRYIIPLKFRIDRRVCSSRDIGYLMSRTKNGNLINFQR